MRRSGSVLPLHKLLMKKILHAVGRLYQTPITGWRFTETPYNPIQVLIIAASLSIFCAAGFAQTADNVAEREVHRRQAVIPQGEAALERGKAARLLQQNDGSEIHREGGVRKTIAHRGRWFLQFRPVRSCV